jgi:inner membrane protein
MEIFDNAAVIWFILGFAFFLLEFALPGLIVFFFGVGAWITALLLFFLDMSIDTQLIVFLASSVVTILLFRKGLKKFILIRKVSNEIIEDEFIGKTGIAETDISPGRDGKVDFKGTSWDARSGDNISKGQRVTIVGNESILLIVKSLTN